MLRETIIGWVLVGACSAIIAVLLLSCAAPRMSTETYWPGDAPLLVVEWPEGTEAADVWTTDVDGRALSVAPVESEY